MKKILLSLSVLCAFAQNAISQSNPIVPLPAEQAELFKYNSQPVNMMTGTPEIAYPLYEVNTGKIRVPITLSYHASGIKVSQRATSVGLGWTIMAGGGIARQIKGIEDESPTGWFNHNIPVDSIDRIVDLANGFDIRRNWMNGSPDVQPDFFNFNFAGKSARFIYSKNAKDFVTAPYQPVKIKHNGSADNTFVITDDDGTQYLFRQPVRSLTDNTNAALEKHIVAWNLTQIISADKSDTVTFTYTLDSLKNGGYAGQDVSSYYRRFHYMVDQKTDILKWAVDDLTSSTTTHYESLVRLKEIIFRQGKVTFFANTVRQDYAGNALDSVVVYSKDNGVYNRIKKFGFSYDYFATGRDKSFFVDYRLKLLSFSKEDLTGLQPEIYRFRYNSTKLPVINSCAEDWWGFYNGQTNQNNLMPYQPPAREEFQLLTDHLGFAYREPNVNYIRAGILDTVIYPTGGYTTYKYGVNKYRNIGSTLISSQIQSLSAYGTTRTAIDSSSVIFKAKSTISSKPQNTSILKVDFSYARPDALTNAQKARLTDLTTGTQLFYEETDSPVNGNDTIPRKSFTFSFTSDTSHVYQLFVWVQDAATTTSVKASFTITDTRIDTTYEFGGGLHVDSIASYNLDSTLQHLEVYKYGDQITNNAIESGIGYMPTSRDEIAHNNHRETQTMRYDILTDADHCIYVGGTIDNYIAQSGFPMVTFQGANVTYPWVTKYEYNGNKPNGKTIYNYMIPSDHISIYNPSVPGGFERIDNSLSEGLLTNVYTYRFNAADSTFTQLSQVSNQYAGFNGSIDKSIIFWYNVDRETGRACPPRDPADIGYNFYPITSGGRHIVSTLEQHWDDNNTVQQLTTTYTYNNQNHLQSTRIVNSKGDTIISKILYPGDHTATDVNASVLNAMVTRNITNQPYWQGSYTNGTLLSYKRTIFANNWGTNDSLIAPKMDSTWQLGNDNSLPAISVAYQSYGKYGNIRQIRDDKGITSAYTWTADGTYPLSQTAGAALSQVLYDGFEDANSWTGVTRDAIVAHTGKYAGLINGAAVCTNSNGMTVFLPNATSFRFSGWVYSNGPSATINLLTKTSVSVPSYTNVANISTTETGKWVYLEKEYSIPSGSYIIGISLVNNGSGKVWFDDIKLRPSASQMSTYSFEPLIGMSSKSDEGNHTLYYEFDGLNRLKLIRNKDRNILKMYCYNYAGEIDQCDGAVFYNNYQSKDFNRACSWGGTTLVTYAVEAGRYASRVSLADANAKALADINANGQMYANKMGDCGYYISEQITDTFYSTCTTGGVGRPIVYTMPVGADTSTVSQEDANAKALARFRTLGQAYADQNGTCVYYNTAQTGTRQKTCTDTKAEGAYVTATIPPYSYYSFVSLAAANTQAQSALNDSLTAKANRAPCYYFNDAQQYSRTKQCDTQYVGTLVTYTVPARHDSSTINKDTANAIAFRYAVANSQAYANANGQCLSCVLLFSSPAPTALDNFTITVTNSANETVYNKTFKIVGETTLNACAKIPSGVAYTVKIVSLNAMSVTVNNVTKTIAANGTQTWNPIAQPTVSIVLKRL